MLFFTFFRTLVDRNVQALCLERALCRLAPAGHRGVEERLVHYRPEGHQRALFQTLKGRSRCKAGVSRYVNVGGPVPEPEACQCGRLKCRFQLECSSEVSVNDPDRYPHLLSVKNCFIRGLQRAFRPFKDTLRCLVRAGSVVRYVHLPAHEATIWL